jgi:transposase
MNSIPIEYLQCVSHLVQPFEFVESKLVDERWVLELREPLHFDIPCPICTAQTIRFGTLPMRRVRHLNFEQRPVFVVLTLPRIKCAEHGVRSMPQRLFELRCSVSIAFEDSIMELILLMSKAEIARRQFVSERMIDRIVLRASHRELLKRTSPTP